LELTRCYEILELNTNATVEEIKSAYRNLSLKYHPDRNKNDMDEKFKQIAEAYNILKTHKDNMQQKINSTKSRYYVNKTNHTKTEFRMDDNHNVNDVNNRANINENHSHKITHLLLYGGLSAIAIWIIISEIVK